MATLGWSDQDAALALGVVPVGATKLTWGGNAQGSSDWFDAALEKVGGEQPVRYDDSDGAPIDGDRQARPRRDPGDQLRDHRAGVREAQQDRPGRRLPRGAVGHPVADLAGDGRQGARPQPARPRRSRPTTQQEIDAAKAEHPAAGRAPRSSSPTSPPPTSPRSASTPPRTRGSRSCTTSAWSTRRRSPAPSSPVSSTARSPRSGPPAWTPT